MATRRIQKQMPLDSSKNDSRQSFRMPYTGTIKAIRAWMDSAAIGLGLSGLRWRVIVGGRDITGAYPPNTPAVGSGGALENLNEPVTKGELVEIRKTGIAATARVSGTILIEVSI